MYNAKFTLSDGTELYPMYFNKEQRKLLKEQIGNKTEVMWCSCRNDKKLYYRLSEDLRFYPEHNNYVHSPYCIRYQTDENHRKTAIVRSDEETAVIFLQFNPKNFTIPTAKEDETENQSEDDELRAPIESDNSDENEMLHLKQLKVDNSEYKEPKFNFTNFIRCINYDTFSERSINNKPILSKDYFAKAIFGRGKFLRISGMKKSIRDLSLDEDGIRFIYAQFKGCDIKESSSYVSYHILIGNDTNTYSLFTFGSIYEKELKRFHKQYGIEPNCDTMVAGFQYYPKSKNGNHYKVIGRLHLFQVSDNGIYCSSMFEQDCYNKIIQFVKKHNKENICFSIPAEDEVINGIFEIKGFPKKGVIIFASSKASKKFTIEHSLFIPLLVDANKTLTEDSLCELVKQIKMN